MQENGISIEEATLLSYKSLAHNWSVPVAICVTTGTRRSYLQLRHGCATVGSHRSHHRHCSFRHRHRHRLHRSFRHRSHPSIHCRGAAATPPRRDVGVTVTVMVESVSRMLSPPSFWIRKIHQGANRISAQDRLKQSSAARYCYRLPL